MQIVIDVSKEVYERFEYEYREKDLISPYVVEVILNAFTKGIVLPEGHGRLIDADKTISEICGSSCGCHLEECGYDNSCYSVARISSASTIIEADKAESEG